MSAVPTSSAFLLRNVKLEERTLLLQAVSRDTSPPPSRLPTANTTREVAWVKRSQGFAWLAYPAKHAWTQRFKDFSPSAWIHKLYVFQIAINDKQPSKGGAHLPSQARLTTMELLFFMLSWLPVCISECKVTDEICLSLISILCELPLQTCQPPFCCEVLSLPLPWFFLPDFQDLGALSPAHVAKFVSATLTFSPSPQCLDLSDSLCLNSRSLHLERSPLLFSPSTFFPSFRFQLRLPCLFQIFLDKFYLPGFHCFELFQKLLYINQNL